MLYYIAGHSKAKMTVVIVPESVTLREAAAAVAAVDTTTKVAWYNDGRGFDDPDEALNAADRRPPNIYTVLEIVCRYSAKITFMLGIENVESLTPVALTQERFRGLHAHLKAQPAKMPQCVLMVRSKEAARALVGDLQVDEGRIELPADPTGPFSVDWNRFRGNNPDSNVPWAFPDEPNWPQAIDSLSARDASRLVDEGVHHSPVARLQATREELAKHLVNRRHAIEMMIACALSRVNLVFLGPPGTAKSLLVRTFSAALGIRRKPVPIREEAAVKRAMQSRRLSEETKEGRRLFEYLLTRYTTPEEIFGGTDIDMLLSSGVHFRRTAGMLPCAEVAFLDEIFKANSAILNALLSITNERIFYNMGVAFQVDLAFVVGASNEKPDDAELGALYDRFPIRVPCFPVPTKWAGEVMQKAHGFDVEDRIGRLACLNDVRLLGRLLKTAIYCTPSEPFDKASPEFLEGFELLMKRARQEFSASDRTVALIARLCRALALLDDTAQRLEVRHLRAWGYVSAEFNTMRKLQQWVGDFIRERDKNAGQLFDEW